MVSFCPFHFQGFPFLSHVELFVGILKKISISPGKMGKQRLLLISAIEQSIDHLLPILTGYDIVPRKEQISAITSRYSPWCDVTIFMINKGVCLKQPMKQAHCSSLWHHRNTLFMAWFMTSSQSLCGWLSPEQRLWFWKWISKSYQAMKEKMNFSFFSIVPPPLPTLFCNVVITFHVLINICKDLFGNGGG